MDYEQWDASIGAAIRAIRETRGMSQGELAAAIGVTQGAISRFENSRQKMTRRNCWLLCRALETRVSTLFALAEQLAGDIEPARAENLQAVLEWGGGNARRWRTIRRILQAAEEGGATWQTIQFLLSTAVGDTVQ